MVSPASFPGYRSLFDRSFLKHRCTVTSESASVEDAHGDAHPLPGDAITGVPCLFSAVQRTVRNADGVTSLSGPTLMASATGPVRQGVRISDVQDALGVVIAAGPLVVDGVAEDTSGLGASLVGIWKLNASDTELS